MKGCCWENIEIKRERETSRTKRRESKTVECRYQRGRDREIQEGEWNVPETESKLHIINVIYYYIILYSYSIVVRDAFNRSRSISAEKVRKLDKGCMQSIILSISLYLFLF